MATHAIGNSISPALLPRRRVRHVQVRFPRRGVVVLKVRRRARATEEVAVVAGSGRCDREGMGDGASGCRVDDIFWAVRNSPLAWCDSPDIWGGRSQMTPIGRTEPNAAERACVK